jgi:hypothetical protein
MQQMVPAVVGAYQCNGTVDWLEEEHPYYPPTVNDPGAAEFAKGVVGQLLGTSNVSGYSQLVRLRAMHSGSGGVVVVVNWGLMDACGCTGC